MEKEQISVNVGELIVYNGENEPVQLASLWEKKTAVMIFVRHFG